MIIVIERLNQPTQLFRTKFCYEGGNAEFVENTTLA